MKKKKLKVQTKIHNYYNLYFLVVFLNIFCPTNSPEIEVKNK